MSFLKKIIILSLLMLLGCQTLTTTPVEIMLSPEVTYTGKGAGAGIALMSAMGPSGIAIGAAIDVGIGKKIQATINYQNLESRFTSLIIQHNTLQLQNKKIQLLKINKLKFQSVSGEKDPTAVIIDGSITFINGEIYVFENTKTENNTSRPLEKLKTKNHVTDELIISTLNDYLSKI
ncbi:MAG TPA: hypothetical protein ENH88_16985 [Pseudoalteromonas prydzensis]|uniref:Lipoprotein n=1 Tax=Pseudoalteromonas prydzensis TaxID=182141 RepID=A0A7V1D1E9_9GAMM|nr:hypothetical protein [Pseudoalteromonas prydzensis]HEA18100.1 hypothetical protein [Pseudoalteromonas prydzensis]